MWIRFNLYEKINYGPSRSSNWSILLGSQLFIKLVGKMPTVHYINNYTKITCKKAEGNKITYLHIIYLKSEN
jgi:hypothetical protein